MADITATTGGMETSLARYIWRHTRSQQIWILAIVLLSMPTYFLALDLPKRIVNGPIQGQGFEQLGSTQTYLTISVPFTDIVLYDGAELTRLGALALLSGLFLLLVCVNGLFKFYINTYKGRLGERMLRRLRYELVDRVLRFPIPQFRKMKASEVSTMVKDEVEPLGGFIGDAFVLPVFLGGQALTALTFIIVQNAWLGMLALGIVLVQAFIIPKLRRILIRLAKERQLTARQLSGRVGEIVDGIPAVHTNDTSNYERSEITGRLGKIFMIRYEFYQKKFFIKFLNNFLAQFTPFLFYSIGGYLAIRGELDIGQLVAVIAAYKDLPAPVKELIDWDQQRVDVQVKYEQVTEQFTVENIINPELQKVSTDPSEPLEGQVEVANLTVVDDSGANLIERADYAGNIGEIVAVIGGVNSGAETFVEALARVTPFTTGSIRIGGNALNSLPESVTGRRLGYADSEGYIAQAPVVDTLLYSLKHAPFRPYDPGEDFDERERNLLRNETRLSGNIELEIEDDWIDYESAGIEGPEQIDELVLNMMAFVELDGDIHDLGLRSIIDPVQFPDLNENILDARKMLREKLENENMAKLVEVFDPDSYNAQSTIAENLFFGRATSKQFAEAEAYANPYTRKILTQAGLDEKLYAMGIEIARNMNELFADLSPDDPLFDQFAFFKPDEMPHYQSAVVRYGDTPFADADTATRDLFLRLPFSYSEPRHRFGLIDEDLQNDIVEARKLFRDSYPEDMEGEIAFYDPDAYNTASTIEDNVIFGRIATGTAEAPERIRKLVLNILEELGLGNTIRKAGLFFDVGTAGKRLSQPQRQKINMARSLIKRPDLILVNRAIAGLDPRTQELVMDRVLADARGENGRKYGLIWALAQPAHASKFDRVLVFQNGVLVEDGTPDELKDAGGQYADLVS